MAPGPKDYYPDPGSIWIAENSCGACHVGYVYRTELSLMNTEAGKIQGNLHTWGFEEVANFKVPYGNYDVEDLDGHEPFFGSEQYKEYMKQPRRVQTGNCLNNPKPLDPRQSHLIVGDFKKN